MVSSLDDSSDYLIGGIGSCHAESLRESGPVSVSRTRRRRVGLGGAEAPAVSRAAATLAESGERTGFTFHHLSVACGSSDLVAPAPEVGPAPVLITEEKA